jgi:iron(III) transport system ATP-binding protein
MNVTQNVAYGLHRGNHKNQQVQKVLELVGMTDLANRMPHELSGGQQQRVALARALAPEPELILLDEPFSNLDPSLREQVRRDMVGIIKASNVTAIFVTHDQEEALLIGDRIAIMNGGSLEHIGSAEDIFHRPANKFTANFVGTVDFISGSQLKGQLVSEIGSINYSNDVHKDDILEVMTRPDCIECVPNEAGSCLIASREFRGAFYMYNVELPSGNTIRCLLSHTQEYNIGDRVDVVLRHSHSLLPFKNGVLDLSPGQ